MEIRQLRHFVEVIRTGSFTRAAETLFITQSALSRSIQALEESVGGVLLDRDGRQIEPTSLGRTVMEHAYHVLHEVDALRQSVHLVREGDRGRLRLGLGTTAGTVLMLPFAELMVREHPKVNLTVLRGNTETLLEMLRSLEVDIVVVEAGGVSPEDGFHIELLAELQGGQLCRADHPLAGRTGLTIEEVTQYPIAASPSNAQLSFATVQHFGPEFHPDKARTLCSNDSHVLLQLALKSDVIYWGARVAAQDLLRTGQLVQLQLAKPFVVPTRQVMVTLSYRHKNPDPLFEHFRQFAREHLRDA